jgi:hypothetical protein
MRLLAQDLATTGRLRAGLSLWTVAAVIWSMNSQEFYLLLVESAVGHPKYSSVGWPKPGSGCCWIVVLP